MIKEKIKIACETMTDLVETTCVSEVTNEECEVLYSAYMLLKKLHKNNVKEYVYSLMVVPGSSECLIGWEYYNENRDIMDELFHVEYSHGDNKDSVVRVIENEKV